VAGEIEGWKGSVMRFLAAFYPGTGVRPSELRLARMEDLDLDTWEFTVRHPKGESSWGERRTVKVMPPARPAVLRYLKAREEYIRSSGLEKATALIPNCYRGKDEFFSSNALREIKRQIQKRTGVKFRLKDFRPTFAQMVVEKDPSLLPDGSKVLGHSNTATTQKCYAQIRGSTALQRIEHA
jgi:integrase